MMQLASDTMYQAGSKTLLDLVLQQNSGHSVYQVRNMATADNIFSTFSRTWAPSRSPSSGMELTGQSLVPAMRMIFSICSPPCRAGCQDHLSLKRTKRYFDLAGCLVLLVLGERHHVEVVVQLCQKR